MVNPPSHRHIRSRDPFSEGLRLDTVSSMFGKTALVILAIVGLVLVLHQPRLLVAELQPVTVVLSAKPYQPPGVNHDRLLLIPTAHHQTTLLVERFTLQAGLQKLKSELEKGDTIVAWLTPKNWEKFTAKGRPSVTLIQQGGRWLVSEADYNAQLSKNSRTGWFLLALVAALLPYLFIQKPKIPVGWLLGVFLVLGLVWLIWF